MLLQASQHVTAYYMLLSAPAHVCMWLPTVAPHGVTVAWFMATRNKKICGVCVMVLAKIQIAMFIRARVWELPPCERLHELVKLMDHFRPYRTYAMLMDSLPTSDEHIFDHLNPEARTIATLLSTVFQADYDADINALCAIMEVAWRC